MKKTAKFGIVALLLVTLATSAFAFGGFRNEAAKEALEAGDYTSWKQTMTNRLTKERFNQMRERHTQMEQHREEMEQAMQEGYEVWQEVISETPRGNHLSEVITEENFDTFVEMHNARQDGNFETAKALAEQLGIERPNHKGFGKGFRNRMPLD